MRVKNAKVESSLNSYLIKTIHIYDVKSRIISDGIFYHCHICYVVGLENLENGDRLYNKDLVFLYLR